MKITCGHSCQDLESAQSTPQDVECI